MRIKNTQLWQKCLDNNQDPYGKAVIEFAEQWADEMEARMEDGAEIADVARDACAAVDSRPGFGITGFMYGCAVATLREVWEHGDELQKWDTARWEVA